MKKIVFITLVSLLLLSCARTVTDRTTTLFVEFTFTFREKIDLTNYTYTLIFSDSTTTTITFPDPDVSNFMILPGLPYNEVELDTQQLTISDFYTSYFDTWKNTISFHESTAIQTVNLVSASNSFFNATATSNFTNDTDINLNFEYESNYVVRPQQLVLIFDLAQIYSNLSGTKQVQLLVLDSSDENFSGNLLDIIEEGFQFDINSGEFESGIDNTNDTDDGAADIIEWRVRVF